MCDCVFSGCFGKVLGFWVKAECCRPHGRNPGEAWDNPSQNDAGEVAVAVAVAVQKGLLRHSVGLQGCCSAFTPLQGCESTPGEKRVL